MLLLAIIIGFTLGGWLIGKLIANLLFPKSEDPYRFDSNNSGDTHITNHNYITENHLHISKEDLKDLIGKSSTDT